MAKKKPAEPEKKGRGRPATGRVRDVRLAVWMSAEERAEIESAAIEAGMTISGYMLHSTLAVARMTKKR